MSEKEYKVSDIRPAFTKLKMRFIDGDWKPTNIAIRIEDDQGTQNKETDSSGKVEANVIGSKVEVLLFGDTEEE